MQQRRLTLTNRLGLHARAAAVFVKAAAGFAAEIRVSTTDREADGKSIMSVMMLAAPVGTELLVTATGEDEDAAINAIAEVVEARFGEDH